MLVLLLFVSLLLHAPAQGCLPVELRDAAGLPVAAIVEVRAEHGQSLALATTGAGGRAVLCALPIGSAVLLSVTGQLPDGTPLVQQGMDAAGMRVFVDGSLEPLLLRVEPTGEVVTDPAGWASEPVPEEATPALAGEVPVVDVPTARPTVLAAPTLGAVEPTVAPTHPALPALIVAPTRSVVPVPDVSSVVAPAALSVGAIVGPPLCVMVLAVVAGVGVVWFRRRRNKR